MGTKPLVVERTYNANINKVWKAISDRDQMKEWYFDLKEFRPEKGFKFEFTGGDETKQYLHECIVLEADPPHKLSYSWRYPGYEGYSVVTFELFEEGEKKTRLRLSHDGLDSFPKDDANFGVASFTGGWTAFLGESLRNYVETVIIKRSVTISATTAEIWKVLLNPDNQWGKAFGGGAFVKTDWTPGTGVVWTDLQGGIGARGVIKDHQPERYLQMDYYDDIHAPAGTATVLYSEKFILFPNENGNCVLTMESGELSKKYYEMHSKMWDEAMKLIKELSEKKL